VLKVLATSTDTMNRWGFAQGQGRLVGAQLGTMAERPGDGHRFLVAPLQEHLAAG
jgi:hypothetical protein